MTKFFLTIDSNLVNKKGKLKIDNFVLKPLIFKPLEKADSEYLEELDFRQIITKTAKLLAEMNLRLAREDCKV